MKRSSVKDIDRGWNRIKRELSATKEKEHVVVGIREQNNSREDGQFTNAQIGAVHEFGSEDRKIPERSFIRATVAENAKKYQKLVKQLLTKVVASRTFSKDKALKILGERIRADIINRINRGIDPALADATIDRKGSSKPLIDTGQLKQSIDYEVRA